MDQVKVLITGSRDWIDYSILKEEANLLPLNSIIIHGNARGADRLFARACLDRGISQGNIRSYSADWNKYGPAAGVIRNQRMIEWEHLESPDPINLVLAFPLNHSIGTFDMLNRCLKYEIRGIIRVDYLDDYNYTEYIRYENLFKLKTGER